MSVNINQKYMVDESNMKDSTYTNKNRKSEFNSAIRKFSAIEKVIVHCTATDSPKWDDPIACINYDIRPNHVSKRGCYWATYHYYINKQGEVYQLVSTNLETWNVAGHNKDSIAICINHGADKDNVTPEQYNSLIDTISYVFDLMDWDYSQASVEDRLFFHRDFNPGKTCPGRLNKAQVLKDVVKDLEIAGDDF